MNIRTIMIPQSHNLILSFLFAFTFSFPSHFVKAQNNKNKYEIENCLYYLPQDGFWSNNCQEDEAKLKVLGVYRNNLLVLCRPCIGYNNLIKLVTIYKDTLLPFHKINGDFLFKIPINKTYYTIRPICNKIHGIQIASCSKKPLYFSSYFNTQESSNIHGYIKRFENNDEIPVGFYKFNFFVKAYDSYNMPVASNLDNSDGSLKALFTYKRYSHSEFNYEYSNLFTYQSNYMGMEIDNSFNFKSQVRSIDEVADFAVIIGDSAYLKTYFDLIKNQSNIPHEISSHIYASFLSWQKKELHIKSDSLNTNVISDSIYQSILNSNEVSSLPPDEAQIIDNFYEKKSSVKNAQIKKLAIHRKNLSKTIEKLESGTPLFSDSLQNAEQLQNLKNIKTFFYDIPKNKKNIDNVETKIVDLLSKALSDFLEQSLLADTLITDSATIQKFNILINGMKDRINAFHIADSSTSFIPSPFNFAMASSANLLQLPPPPPLPNKYYARVSAFNSQNADTLGLTVRYNISALELTNRGDINEALDTPTSPAKGRMPLGEYYIWLADSKTGKQLSAKKKFKVETSATALSPASSFLYFAPQ